MADLDPETKALLEKLLADAQATEQRATVAEQAARQAEQAAVKAENEAVAAGDLAAGMVEDIEAALEGDVIPPPAEGLILKLSNVKAPVELPAGKLLGTRTVVGVMKLPAADGKYRKLLGADFTAGKQGGFCIGQAANGKAEFWIDDGSGLQQIMHQSRPGKASFVAMRITSEAFAAMVDDRNEAKNAVAVPFDGAAAVGAGYYGHQLKDPMPPAEWLELEVWADLKDWAWIAAKKEEWKDLIDEGGGNGGGNGGDLEPVDGSATQVAVVAEGVRQTIRGFGAGTGPVNELAQVFPRMQQYAKTDFDDLGINTLRLIWSGDGGNLGRAYKPLIDWAKARMAGYGAQLWVHATGYGYTEGDPIGSANRLAASIKAGVDTGCQIDSVCMQNEPGGTDPHWPDGDHAPAHRQFRVRLNELGLQRISIIGLEYSKDDDWRDPRDGVRKSVRSHFDRINEAGLVPGSVAFGGVHSYGDCLGAELYDKRWMTKGSSVWQLEAGFGNIPSIGARMLNDINCGASVWINHLLQAYNPDKPNDYGQKLVDMNGRPNIFYHPFRIISTKVLPGTVMRLCTANGGRPVYTQGSKSPLFVAAGKRADGKWVVAAQSCNGGKRQTTFRIPEAAGVTRTMAGERVNTGGAASPYSVKMVDGLVRFTVGNNEIAVLVG